MLCAAPAWAAPDSLPPLPAASVVDPSITALPSEPESLLPPATEWEKQQEFLSALANLYETQPQLKAQREAQKALDESVNQAISGFRPDVEAGYSVGRNRSNDTNDVWDYRNSQQRSISVTQPVFSGGGTLASFKAARERVKAGRAQLTAVEQQVLYNGVVAYTDWVQKQSVLEVNRHNVDVLQKQLDATQARYDVGELTKTDIAQSQARLASAESGERQAQGDLESSRATFFRIIGFEPPPGLELPPVPVLPESMQQAIDWAHANEPTLQAARHVEVATDSDINVGVASLLPSASVQGTASRGNDSIPGLGRGDNDSIRLNLTIPLYQSGAEWSRVRAAKNLAQQAKFTYFDTRAGVTENVTRAWQDYQTVRAVITSNEQAVKAAREALEGIHQETLYGTRTILDMLNTEQDLFNAQLDLIKAKVAEKQQAYRLLAAVGKLTASDLKLDVDLDDPKKHYDDVKYKLIGF